MVRPSRIVVGRPAGPLAGPALFAFGHTDDAQRVAALLADRIAALAAPGSDAARAAAECLAPRTAWRRRIALLEGALADVAEARPDVEFVVWDVDALAAVEREAFDVERSSLMRRDLFGVIERVDILTGTLGKALGGASGGYTCARSEVVELLRQRSRPYLFSNSLAPSIVAATLACLDLLETSSALLERLAENTAYFRRRMVEEGFEIPESDHPIVPVMLGDAVLAARMADEVLSRGVYVRAFSFPVVPRGAARIRTQMSAGLSRADLDAAIAAFVAARAAVGA